MSSSEEYLDSLLRALTEGESHPSEDSALEASESDTADGMQEDAVSNDSAPGEPNTAMSMNEIEAMFASMGEMTPEEAETDESLLSNPESAENLLSDELALEETIDDFVLDENLMPEEVALEEEEIPEELSDDVSEDLPDELLVESLEESLGDLLEESIDDFVLDESLMPEEVALEEEEIPEELSDDVSDDLPDELLVEPLEESLGDLPEESIDDFVLDESLMPEEVALEGEEIPEELSDDVSEDLPDELLVEPLEESLGDLPEESIDDFVLDESLMPEEVAMEEEEIPDELLEESLGDLPEESIDDFVLDESLMPEEVALEEEEALEELPDEDMSDDLGLDDFGLGDLGLEDAVTYEESGEHFALEESGEDDEDLSALLAGMGSDEDLAEINDLLEIADQGMSNDEDILAMLGDVSESDEDEGAFDLFAEEETAEGDLENIREITPEELEEREYAKLSRKEKKQLKKERKKAERERKKKEKQDRKNKKKNGTLEEDNGETDNDEDSKLNDLLASMDAAEEKSKKQGFFGKILTALLEEDEDEEAAAGEGEAGSEIASLSEENQELLAELKAEDKKNAKKKEKKEKKGKKGKKGAETGAEGEVEEVEIKKKKPKKEKKKKEKNPEEELKVPEKKLSKKKVTSIFLFCATVAACIIVLSTLLPNQIEKQEARVAYDYKQYEQVYDLLYGKKLSEEDEALFEKSSIILQTKRKLESYENYRKLDMPLEALNALIEGVNRYQNLRDEAELYRVSDELYDVYDQILAALADNYGVSESEALDILSAGDDVTYSQRLQSIVYGDVFGSGEENLPEVKQDVLPEEEEIIDRLQDIDNAEVNVETTQPEDIDEVMQAEEEFLGE